MPETHTGRPGGACRRRSWIAAALSVAVCGACGDGSTTTPDPSTPTTITLSASTLSFASLGDSISLTATVRDQDGAVMTVGVSWSSSDDGVACVSSAGVVTAVGNGTATITATAGTATATVEATVEQVVVSVRFESPVVTLVIGEAPLTLQARCEDANGHAVAGCTVAWRSSADAVSVNASGEAVAEVAGWAIVYAAVGAVEGSVVAHAVAPGFPDTPPDMRALHLGGNWLGNQLHAGVPHPDFLAFMERLAVNWVGVSVALVYGESTDPVVRPNYDGPGIRTFTDDVLRTLIREFTSRGVDVYVTLAFEVEPEPGSKVPERWMLGQPWLEGGFQEEDWPWLPTHPDHESFVAEFWTTYTQQAVHFATIAEEEGATLFSLGTETDRLFRTRAEGSWVTQFEGQIRNMVVAVREVFTGQVTYDQVYSTLTEPGFWGTSPLHLWEDAGLDVIGISAYYRLLAEQPDTVVSVAALEDAWESVLADILQPLHDANPGRPILFTELGVVDDVRAPGDPTIEEFQEKQFVDNDGNGLDDGEEVQANILEALYRALETYPVVDATFLWDHAMDADAEIAHEDRLRSTRVRGKLAEDVVRLVYAGSG